MAIRLEANVYGAAEVIRAEESEPLLGGLSFADRSFRPSSRSASFGGAGLYACYHKDQLFYIGKYLGKKKDWRAGNVIDLRWTKHIGTLTMRARSLGFSRKALREIEEHLASERDIPDPIKEGFLSAERGVLQRETGCMTTFNRFRSAAALWAQRPDQLGPNLEDFRFLYVRQNGDFSLESVRKIISEAESLVLSIIQPPANTLKYRNSDRLPAINELAAVFEQKIDQASQTVMGSVSPQPTKTKSATPKEPKQKNEEKEQVADLFKERLEPWQQNLIEKIEEHLDKNRNDAEINFKRSDGVAIRRLKVRGRKFINAVTIEKSGSVFTMRSLLDPKEHKLRSGPDSAMTLFKTAYIDVNTDPVDVIDAINLACDTRCERTGERKWRCK